MRAAVLGVVILAVLIAAPIAAGQSGHTVQDPGEPGPYAVGLARQSFSRVLPDGQTRAVGTNVWYPAPKPADLPLALATSANPNAVVAPGGPFPLIVFSHGSGATSALYGKLLSHLASHGFVVAGPDHQDCSPCTEQALAVAIENRPADVSMVVDGLLALNAGDDPIFGHLVDPERIGVAGHSRGGWTTLAALERDSRFKAGLAMSPGSQIRPYGQPEAVARPLMLMQGMLDAMVMYALTTRFFSDIPASAPDHYLLVAPHVGHQFHNECISGFVTTGCNDTLSQAQVQALMDRFGTAFILRYVAGRRVTDSQLGLHDDDPEYTMLKGTAAGAPPIPQPSPLRSPDPSVASALPGTVLWQAGQGERLPASTDPGRYEIGEVASGFEMRLSRPGAQGEVILPGKYADTSISADVAVDNPTPSQSVQFFCRAESPTSSYRFGFRPATGEIWLTRWLTRLVSVRRFGRCCRRSSSPLPSIRAAPAITSS